MLITVQDVADYLGIVLTAAQQTTLNAVFPGIDGAVKRYLGYDIEQHSSVEFYPGGTPGIIAEGDLVDVSGDQAFIYSIGESSPAIQLLSLPVRSITEVRENISGYGDPTKFISVLDPSAYWMDQSETGMSLSGLLYRRWSAWSLVQRSVMVTYVSGFTANELDDLAPEIKLAFLVTAVAALRQSKLMSLALASGAVGPIKSERLEDYSVTYESTNKWMIGGMVYGLPSEARQYLDPYVRRG